MICQLGLVNLYFQLLFSCWPCVYRFKNPPFHLCALLVALQTDSALVCHTRIPHANSKLLCAIALSWMSEFWPQHLPAVVPGQNQKVVTQLCFRQIEAADIDLQQVSRTTLFAFCCGFIHPCVMAVPGHLFFGPVSDSGLWEFCNCLAGDVQQRHCGCEGFSCKLETYIYCRTGGLWASLNEAFWNHWFPGDWKKTRWRKLAYCSAVCRICEWPWFDNLNVLSYWFFILRK